MPVEVSITKVLIILLRGGQGDVFIVTRSISSFSFHLHFASRMGPSTMPLTFRDATTGRVRTYGALVRTASGWTRRLVSLLPSVHNLGCIANPTSPASDFVGTALVPVPIEMVFLAERFERQRF